MRNFVLLAFSFLLIFSCESQKKFHDFDISYSKSGGKVSAYENLLIKGRSAFYSYDSPEKKFKKTITISAEDLTAINAALAENRFPGIHEDSRKLYDHVNTSIMIKSGKNEGSKTDASGIAARDMGRWQKITGVFADFISKNFKQ